MVLAGLTHNSKVRFALICLLGLMLSACGGGSSSDTPATATAVASSSNSSVSSSSASSTSNTSATTTNHAPTISGTSATVATIGSAYSFKPVAADADGDVLGFSISGTLPPGLSFSTATGAISGTPTTAGNYSAIVISVSDGNGGSASLAAFAIIVSSGTGSATLNWTKPTLNTDGSVLTDLSGYTIYCGLDSNDLTTVCASISSGDTLTSTISNLAKGVTYYFAIASVSASSGEGEKSGAAAKTI